MTETIHYECVSAKCGAGMEIYTDFNGNKRKHRVSFEANIGEFTFIKRGQLIPSIKCYKCENETLVKA